MEVPASVSDRDVHPRFLLDALRLAVELDGVGHVPSRDSFRTSVLQRYGIEVIRLSNEDIIGNPEGAWEHIVQVIAVRAAFVRQKNAFDSLHGDNDQ
jgi:very-short-patch-repair endonuclease